MEVLQFALGIPSLHLRPLLSPTVNTVLEKLRIEIGTDKNKFAFIQAEDELAAMGMTIGANPEWC